MGLSSYLTDEIFDALENNGLNDIYEFSASELAEALERHAAAPMHESWDEEHLGMVTWGLLKGKLVPTPHLQMALNIAKKIINNTNKLHNWTNQNKRIEAIRQEIKTLEFALANNGIAPAPKTDDLVTAHLAKVRSSAIN